MTAERLAATFAAWKALDDRVVALRANINSLRCPAAPPVFNSYEEGMAHVAARAAVERERGALEIEIAQTIEQCNQVGRALCDLIGQFPSPVRVSLDDGTVWSVWARYQGGRTDVRVEQIGGDT